MKHKDQLENDLTSGIAAFVVTALLICFSAFLIIYTDVQLKDSTTPDSEIIESVQLKGENSHEL